MSMVYVTALQRQCPVSGILAVVVGRSGEDGKTFWKCGSREAEDLCRANSSLVTIGWVGRCEIPEP
jgi:hypothetical protein